MKCRQTGILISAKTDNQISPRETQQLEQHLKLCSKCRSQVPIIKEYKKIVKSIDEVSMPAELEENILSLISEQDRPEPAKIASKPVIPLFYKVAAAAALLLAFVWIIDPGEIFSPVSVSATFVPMVQKDGKGPKKGAVSEPMGAAERDVKLVKDLIYKYNGSLIEEKHESVMDSILQVKAVIKEANYADFIRDFNRISTTPLKEHIRFSFRKKVVVKISFPGRAAYD